MNNKILLVEDDTDISAMLQTYLCEADFLVTVAFDGVEALTKFNEDDYACILLDLMLPKKNGIEVLTEIRKKSFLPVIIISAKESEYDKTIALELGADDYVTKPFSFAELTARVRSSIRRTTLYSETVSTAQSLKHADIEMQLETFTVLKGTDKIKLTSTEYDILKLFLEQPKKVFTKEDIYMLVWKENYYGDENIVNVHMSRLREKIETDTKNPQIIETLWGIGYRLKETSVQ